MGHFAICAKLAVALLTTSSVAQLTAAPLSFFPNDTLTTSTIISSACLDALNASVACDAYIYQLATADTYYTLGNSSMQQSICQPSCGTALSNYRSSVTSSCASDPMPWDGIPATYLVDFVWAYYNGTCLKDPTTGQWCIDYVSNITAALTGEMSITDLPKSQLCSPCIVALFQHQQSTPFSNYDSNMASQWALVQTSCSVTGPTAVASPYATPTTLAGHAPSDIVPSTPTCLSGNMYSVKNGDDPEKIAAANQVATGTLKILNDILPDGSNLFAGQSLCLPQKCTTYSVQSGDICWALASANGISFTQFLAYNPSLNSDCTNLFSGTTICLTLPGNQTYNGTTIAGATATQTLAYASTIAPIPTNAATGTTRKCGKWYNVSTGDYCQVVTIRNYISLNLFTAINPSINSTCGNLLTGTAYCVFPTADWNSTAASTTIAPPAPTPTGSTSQCYQWYVVQSGDGCYVIEQAYEITMAQLQAWNPSLRSDCGNLILGDAYCVSGPNGTSSTSSTPTPTAVPPPGPTQAGVPANCDKWVMQKDGVYCSDMAAAAGITLNQLYAWNPALNGDCSGLWVGYAYCIAVAG